MEWSIAQVDYPTGIEPEQTEILLGIDASLDGNYGRTYLIKHQGELKALHRGGMVGTFRVAELAEESPPRLEAGKWGGEQLVLVIEDGAEKRLRVTHHERDTTLEVLETIYRATEARPELAALLELRLETTHEDQVRLAALAELSSLYCGPLGDPERAVSHLRSLLALRRDDDQAFTLLEALAEGGSLPACDTLEQAYRETKRHEALAQLLLRRADLEPERRLEHQLEASLLLDEEVGAPARALEILLTALTEDPSSTDLLHRADALAEKSQAWTTAATGFRAAEQATEDPRLDAELLWRIGSAHRKTGDLEAATAAMQELTWLDPEHRDALELLATLLGEQERHKPQIEVFERLVALSLDDRERIDWLHRSAHALETKLDDVKAAVAANLRVLALDDHHDATLAALARLYERTAHWQDLVAVLDRRAERAGVELRATLLAKAAQTTETRLGDQESAMRRWRAALNAMPAHEEAMAALTRLFSQHARWLELVNALEQHALGVDDDRAVASLKQAAQISLERMQQRDRATSCYERARELAPDDADVLRALLVAYRDGTTTEPTIDVLGRLLSLATDERERIDLFVERARTLLRAERPEDAISDLEEALGLCPTATEERVRLLLLQGDVQRELDAASAQATFERVLDLDPQNRAAFDRIEPLLRSAEEHAALAELYERRAGFVPEERATWLCRAARLHSEQLQDGAEAARLALEAHRDAWREEGVTEELCAVATGLETWRDVFDELERRHKQVPEGERRRYGKAIDRYIAACRANTDLDADSVLLRAAQHYERARGAPKRALQLYQRAYRRDRSSTDTERRVRLLLKRLNRTADLIVHLISVRDDGVYEGEDQRDLLVELADALVKVDRIEEAEAIRRRLAMPTLVVISVLVAVMALAGLLYFLLNANSI